MWLSVFNLIWRFYIKFRMLLRTGLSIMVERMIPNNVKLMVTAKFALFR